MRTPSATWLAALGGAALGVGLGAATVLVATAGPAGDGWSFRGNGALVVPIGFGAALLAGGWTAVFRYARGASAWATFAAGIAAIAAAPSVISIVLLVALGRTAQTLSDLMTVPALAAPVLALAWGAVGDLRGPPSRRLPRVAAWVAILLFGAALTTGLFASEALVADMAR